MNQLPNFKMPGGSAFPVILVILALLAGLLFYFSIIKPGQINQYELMPLVQVELAKFREFKNIRFGFSIFDRVDFRNLRIFGEAPVKPAPGGKADLFSP